MKNSSKRNVGSKKADKVTQQKNNNISDSIIKIKTKNAIVIGKCKLSKKGSVTNLGFYYQRVEWKNGLIEEHKI